MRIIIENYEKTLKNKTNLPPNSHYCNENDKVYWKIYNFL